jgi:hypothetical protein
VYGPSGLTGLGGHFSLKEKQMSEIKMCPVGCGPLKADGFCAVGNSFFYRKATITKAPGNPICVGAVLRQHCDEDDGREIDGIFYSTAISNTETV